MAVAEGHIRLNPVSLLFTPKDAKRPRHRVMTVQEIGKALLALANRERLIAKLAILARMRPGEIFGLTWGRIGETFAAVEQRSYRHSVRQAALTNGVMLILRNGVARWAVIQVHMFSLPSVGLR